MERPHRVRTTGDHGSRVAHRQSAERRRRGDRVMFSTMRDLVTTHDAKQRLDVQFTCVSTGPDTTRRF